MDAESAERWKAKDRLGALVRSPGMVAALVRLAIAGLLAIGVSGAVAAAMGAAYGRSFVSGDPPGVTYSKARCADYFEYEPGSRTCEQAATLHHYGETVEYRSAAGILGLILLVAYLVARPRLISGEGPAPGVTALVATLAFGLAAVGLVGFILPSFIQGQRAGVGDYLSAGIISAVAAVISGASFAVQRRRKQARREINGTSGERIRRSGNRDQLTPRR